MDNKSKVNNNSKNLTDLPTKRAAYSDRTALEMAKLSRIVYTNFNSEEGKEIKKELNDIGFELVDTVSYKDTQAIIALRKENAKNNDNDSKKYKFAVVCFRGTEISSYRDWTTSFDVKLIKIQDPKDKKAVIGHMHKGYHLAYQPIKGTVKGIENANAVNGPVKGSIAYKIDEILGQKVDENLPIYLTGHSMGGAIAVVATWYMKMQRLAACYTFGAPKIGDIGLLGRFRTPIYRVVNGRDPIPNYPPIFKNAENIGFWKLLFHKINIKEYCADEKKYNKIYVPYGNMKYIPIKKKNKKSELLIHPYKSICQVIKEFGKPLWSNAFKFKKFHGIKKYEDKLEIIAENRNPILEDDK